MWIQLCKTAQKVVDMTRKVSLLGVSGRLYSVMHGGKICKAARFFWGGWVKWPVWERGWALTTILTLFTWNIKCLSSFLQATLAKHYPNRAAKILDCQVLVTNCLGFWLDGVGFKDCLHSGWPRSLMVWDFGWRVWDLKTFQMVRSVLVSDGLEFLCCLFMGRFHKGYGSV